MNDTPRTENELLPSEGNNREKVYADFARNLEREIRRLQFLLWHRSMNPNMPLTVEELDHITAHLKRPVSV